jgi:hypothetical protein
VRNRASATRAGGESGDGCRLALSRRAEMAKNKTPGDSKRVGAVKTRSQIKNPITGTWTKRDDKSGKFMDVKADAKPFKGVRKEK